jgi:hypothetical protein
MNKKLIGILGASLMLATATAAFADYNYNNSSSMDDGYTYETELLGKNEVPPVPQETSGHAGVWFGKDGQDMNYWLSAFDGEDLTAGHIHCGAPGQNGPVVVSLYSGSNNNADGEIARGYIDDSDVEASAGNCASVIGYRINDLRDLARAIKEGKTYVNLHSAQYPNGVARGQLGSWSTNNNRNLNYSSYNANYDQYGYDRNGYDRNGNRVNSYNTYDNYQDDFWGDSMNHDVYGDYIRYLETEGPYANPPQFY